jgi:hypothetical protein
MNNQPTENQKNALRKFKIPEQEIAKMTFQDAKGKLSELINNAYPRAKTIPETPPSEGDKVKEVASIPIPSSLSRNGIEQRLSWAITTINNMPSTNYEFDVGDIIAELMREDHAAAMSEFIQHSKERNIKSVRDSKGY